MYFLMCLCIVCYKEDSAPNTQCNIQYITLIICPCAILSEDHLENWAS